MRILIAALLATILPFCFAKAQEIPVYVGFAGDDLVGQRLAYQFKDEIRKSGAFEIEYSEEAAIFDVKMITLDPEEASDQTYTVYSLTFTLSNADGFNYYLDSYVGTCGSDAVPRCAEKMVQNLGTWGELMREVAATRVASPFE